MAFAHPGFLWLIVLAALPLVFAQFRPRLAWPSLEGFRRKPRFGWTWLASFPLLARMLAIAALAVGLARPRTIGGEFRIAGQGVAIAVVLDHSSSMTTRDFPVRPGLDPIERLEAARRTFAEFVSARADDLIGLIAFANYPDLVCPLTLDHALLLELGAGIKPARPGDDGTNIGDAVAVGLNALRESSPRKKVLVLLTDGNNDPAVPNPLDPLESAALARDLGVTLYAVAIGSFDRARLLEPPSDEPADARRSDGPNMPLLEHMANLTGGRAFASGDLRALEQVFKTIDTLEKSPVQGRILTRYNEHYPVLAFAAVVLLGLDLLCSQGRLRRIP